MKKVTCYSEIIEVDEEIWTLTLIPTGTGKDTVYYAYLFDACGHAKEIMGFPVNQMQAKVNPHIYTPSEIMEMALCHVDNFIGDLNRIEQFENILFEHFIETDCIRAENAELYNSTRTDSDRKEVE